MVLGPFFRSEGRTRAPRVASDCEGVSQACNSITRGEFASSRLTGKSVQSCKRNSRRGFVDLSFVLEPLTISLSLSFSLCHLQRFVCIPLPSMGDIFRRKKCFWRVSFLLPVVRYFYYASISPTCFHSTLYTSKPLRKGWSKFAGDKNAERLIQQQGRRYTWCNTRYEAKCDVKI